MNRKERNKMDLLAGSDVFRLIRKSMKQKGYDTSVEEIKEIFNSFSELTYTCLLNGIRVTVPNIGEFFRDIKKGRKAGYYKVPNSRDEHTKFDKNMVWTQEYMDKAPDYGKIDFVEYPRVKKKFREETTGKV
jgi:nucleoid DNA-binding protein